MIVKFVSLVSLICSLAIASVNLQDPSDPLFFIVAGGAWADAVRILLSALLVGGAFFKIPKNIHPEPVLLALGTVLISFGISGFLMNSFDFVLYDYIKPLDFLLVAEVGVISSLIGLEAHTPMFHFSDPYRRTISVAFLPKLRKIKPAAA
jgi:hypothetical protein